MNFSSAPGLAIAPGQPAPTRLRRREPPHAAPAPQALVPLYRRADGRRATRNYLGILAVDAEAEPIARELAARLRREPACAGLDGVLAPGYAPGINPGEDAMRQLEVERLLCARSLHPNFGAVLLVDSGYPGSSSRRVLRELQSVLCDAAALLSLAHMPVECAIANGERLGLALARAASRRSRTPGTCAELVLGLTRHDWATAGSGLQLALSRLLTLGTSVVFAQPQPTPGSVDSASGCSAYGQRIVRQGCFPMAPATWSEDPALGMVAAGAHLLLDLPPWSTASTALCDAVPRLAIDPDLSPDALLARILHTAAGTA